MTVELINLGRIANDGTGDDLREAFIKVNNNFEELDLRQPEATTASNKGASGEGIFSSKVVNDLQFKKIIAGTNITLSSTTNDITISSLGGLQDLNINSDSGTVALEDGDTLTIIGGTDIETSISGTTLTINYTGIASLLADPSPQLGADLEGDQNDIVNINIIQANNFQGSLDGLVYGIDIRTINSYFNDFDFGDVSDPISSAFEYIVRNVDVDMGTATNPSEVEIDFGTS